MVGAAIALLIASPFAAGRTAKLASGGARAKPPASTAPVWARRPQPRPSSTPTKASIPARGAAPRTQAGNAVRQINGHGKAIAPHKPGPPLSPAHGRALKGGPVPAQLVARGKVPFGAAGPAIPPHAGPGPLKIPGFRATTVTPRKRLTPSTFYGSTQLDTFSSQCGSGVNETTIAQSTVNPDLLVAGANTYYNADGTCHLNNGFQDSQAGVYYSSDEGQHWHFEVMPNLQYRGSGDPVVTFDPVRQVFLYAFIEYSRDGSGNATYPGRVGVDVSSDGVNWSRDTTLSTSDSTYFMDKPSITVDQNQGSPHYGRVDVTWTRFQGNNAVYFNAYTDNGGQTWTYGNASINYTSHECGNGTSSAYDANGELMVAWADCSGGTYQLYEELSTDGGATWTAPSDTQITTIKPIGDPGSGCTLNNGGSSFRCNSFPSLAGDPNPSDAGGTAFMVVWAQVTPTTQNGQAASVSQIEGLNTVDGGSTWNGGPGFGFNEMSFYDFGDKFFPAASFAPDGRLTVSYSSNEDDPNAQNGSNPDGVQFDEHQTEAGSLSSLRGNAYVSYTTDGTLGNPGTLSFIGDYSGNGSLDANFDTFPIWTDVRNGFPDIRTQDLCYADCMTFLSPDSPLFINQGAGASFTDFYSFNMDTSSGGSGADYWNVVGIREGSDGTSVDDDMSLAPNRYFNTSLAFSDESPPNSDYELVNGNTGNAPNTVYFPSAHSYASSGGPYSIEWDAGHLILSASLADSLGSGNVARVYDTYLNTGTTYYVGLRPAAGNTSNYSLNLHSATGGAYQGRNNAVADSGDVGVGHPAFVSYNTGFDASQYDAVVAQNDNGGSGAYTLYRDTVAPFGTISINGGATYTNRTTLNVALSATNATSADPVSDMAFSIDGGAYGAFQPYATSATVTIPAGNGVHTVAVEYRNGAGAVSAAASSSITLDQTPPTTTASLSGNSTGCSTFFGSVAVTLTATDPTSGVASTVYQVDSGAVHTYSGPFTVSGTGNHTVTYHSTDHAGNVESTKSAAVSIVVPAGTVSPNSGGPGATATTSGTKFKAGESVKVYWDSTSSTPLATATASAACTVSAPIVVPAAVNGPHTLIAVGQTSHLSANAGYTITAAERLSRTSGPVGTSVTATLAGFKATQSVVLHLGSATGTTLATTSTNSTGGATVAFAIPAAVNGPHTVYAVGMGGPTATATFSVNAAIKLAPTSSPPGASVTATLSGYKASQSVTLRWDTTSGTGLATVTTNTSGGATATFHVPTSTVGTHHVLGIATGVTTVSVAFSVT